MSVDETRTELPPDYLYEQVTMNGDIRIFPDKQYLLLYVHLVTCLLKYYIKAIDAEAIREKIKDKLNNLSAVSKSRQQIFSDFDSQNRDSSQEMDGFRSDMLTPKDKLPLRNVENGESSDKENARIPFSNKNLCVSDSPNQRYNDVKTEYVEKKINKDLIRAVKKDLKILRGLSKHVDMFKCHFEKICSKDDLEFIETELFEIYVMVDNLQS